jgi:uncharacterized small protein (TIGR04563 family)
MAGTEKQKQSLYFSEDTLLEIMREANRLDRSLSWTVQQAWRVAREEIRKFPGVGYRQPEERGGRASAQVREFIRGKFDRDETTG